VDSCWSHYGHSGLHALAQHYKAITEMIDIDTILDTIPETTFNIKIIQLNATIEAASAGEQGSGFAAVAGEFRVWAKRTHEATTEMIDKCV